MFCNGIALLKGIDRVRDVLVENTERFAKGLPANNALLWGARGMGKSSLINLLVPLTVASRWLGQQPVVPPARVIDERQGVTTPFERKLMFCLGLGTLVFVPLFKSLTHLPPFMGILLGLGILWAVGDLVHRQTEDVKKQRLTIARALTRIDMSSIVFFIGILLSVAVL